MQLARHHQLALAGAIGLSSIAGIDAVTHGLTGHNSMFSDEGDVLWVLAAGGVVHGLAYAAALGVLGAERARIGVSRPARVFAGLLAGALVALAVGFIALAPLVVFGVLPQALENAYVVLVGVAFILQFVAAAGLGFSLLRRPQLAAGSRILLAILPVFGLTLLVTAVAPEWAHPAYLEATTLLGIALLGTAKPVPSRPSGGGADLRASSA